MNGRHCVQCRSKLTPGQTRFCGGDYRRTWKRESMRKLRGFSDHEHICRECGKAIPIGRPPVA